MEANHVWLTSTEAGKHLKLSPRTVIEMARAGRLPGHILSGLQRHTWRFLASELDSAIMGSPAVSEKARVQ